MVLLYLIIICVQFLMVDSYCTHTFANHHSFYYYGYRPKLIVKSICQVRYVNNPLHIYEQYELPINLTDIIDYNHLETMQMSEISITIEYCTVNNFSMNNFINNKIACNYGEIELLVDNSQVRNIQAFPRKLQQNKPPFTAMCNINYQSINFNGNYIQKLDTLTFYNLTTLEEIDLSNNSIANMGPLTFDNLQKLFTLTLANNNLSSIGSAFGKLNILNELNLSGNIIENVSKSDFENLTSLNHLDLSNNRLTNIKSGTFIKLNVLETLKLSNNYLKVLELGTFSGLLHLQKLCLSHNSIIPTKALIINTPNLSHLNLSFNALQDMDVQLFKDHAMSHIDINGNNFSCRQVVHIIQAFRSVHITVEYGLENDRFSIYGLHCYDSNDTMLEESQANNTNTEFIKFLNHGFTQTAFYDFFSSYLPKVHENVVNNETNATLLEILRKIESKETNEQNTNKQILEMIKTMVSELERLNIDSNNASKYSSMKEDNGSTFGILVVIMCFNALMAMALVLIVFSVRQSFVKKFKYYNDNYDTSDSRNFVITDNL